MEALVFDGNALTVQFVKDHPMPKLVRDTDVIVSVEFAGVCGTDVHIIQGEFPAAKKKFTPGHEFCGSVHEAGSKSNFQKGQKVVVDPNSGCLACDFCRSGYYQYCLTGGLNSYMGIWQNGGWAQFSLVPHTQVHLLPEGVSTKQGGLTEPYSCIVHAYRRAQPVPVGKKLLILGAGIIGNIWVSIFHHQGHRDVTVSEPNQKRLDITKKLNTGCRLVTPDVIEKEKDKVLYDFIFDNTGIADVMSANFNYLNHGGKYVVFGCCPPDKLASINPFDMFNKEITIVGAKINPYAFPGAIAWLKAMGDRYLDYDNLGVKTYDLSDYKSALGDLKKGIIAKAVFKMRH